MKKPSERIDEIYEELNKPDGTTTVAIWQADAAIARYLDEEKERVNGVLRAIVDNMGGYIPVGAKRLHAMIDETVTGSDK